MPEPIVIAMPEPACWCVYGREGREVETPGCPAHDPQNTPRVVEREVEPCEVCLYEREDCHECGGDGDDGYASDGRCFGCGGSGEVVPDHCCFCGGSPYCDCCKHCGECIAACSCPVVVELHDGGTLTLGAARSDRPDDGGALNDASRDVAEEAAVRAEAIREQAAEVAEEQRARELWFAGKLAQDGGNPNQEFGRAVVAAEQEPGQRAGEVFADLICHGCGDRGEAWSVELADDGTAAGIWCRGCSEVRP